MDELQLGNRIRAFRKLKGYTQQDFAKELGISVAILGSIERGMRTPSDKMLQHIVEILHIDISDLMEQRTK